ncbi:bacterial regulatory helix-turn-helix, lysR family protein [Acinetobacter baumannii 831240]|nr:bacterial regulatory helix-turn-helix, lysR family protein [Acinetobacter baumannii 831240]
MDKFDTLQLFTRIVELGSFSQAADQLNIPRATASNAIKELENNLQCRLLERTTRHVRPSLDGQAFYERCTQILSELDDAESSLRNVIAQPRGLLRVIYPVHMRLKLFYPISTNFTSYTLTLNL